MGVRKETGLQREKEEKAKTIFFLIVYSWLCPQGIIPSGGGGGEAYGSQELNPGRLYVR